jgi:hypothetical protein
MFSLFNENTGFMRRGNIVWLTRCNRAASLQRRIRKLEASVAVHQAYPAKAAVRR